MSVVIKRVKLDYTVVLQGHAILSSQKLTQMYCCNNSLMGQDFPPTEIPQISVKISCV